MKAAVAQDWEGPETAVDDEEDFAAENGAAAAAAGEAYAPDAFRSGKSI